MKFDNLLLEMAKDIFVPVSRKEIDRRREEYINVKMQDILKRGKQNADGSWDIEGEVDISDMDLTKIPVKFNRVNGDFQCQYNYLTSLVGAPRHVEGSFLCHDNELTSLKWSPRSVGGDFNCSENNREFTGADVREVSMVEGIILE
jgi:hypothetical protein